MAPAPTKRRELEDAIQRLIGLYGLNVPCDRCGAKPLWPCISPTGRITVHNERVTMGRAV